MARVVFCKVSRFYYKGVGHLNKERETKNNKQCYFWQPELYASLISWSATFFVLFASLIMSLENNQPYLASNLVLFLFFILFLCGIQRRFHLYDQYLEIIYFIPFNKEKIPFEKIDQIVEGPKGVKLIFNSDKEARIFMMKVNSRKKFIQRLKKHPEMPITISYDKNLSTSRE